MQTRISSFVAVAKVTDHAMQLLGTKLRRWMLVAAVITVVGCSLLWLWHKSSTERVVVVDGVRATGWWEPKTPESTAPLPGKYQLLVNGSRSPPTATATAKPTPRKNRLEMSGGSNGLTWEKNTFCGDFLSVTFRDSVSVCGVGEEGSPAGGGGGSSSLGPPGERDGSGTTAAVAVKKTKKTGVECWRTPHSVEMALCLMRDVEVDPQGLYHAMASRESRMRGSKTIHLVDGGATDCVSPNLQPLRDTTETLDPTRMLVEEAVTSGTLQGRDACDTWVNETTFIFMGSSVHIYFKLMAWYNLYKTILEYGMVDENYRILQLAEDGYDYTFKDFEKNLFPGIVPLSELGKGKVCFRELVISPWMYANLLFRCRIVADLNSKCLGCNGQGKDGTLYVHFRSYVLKTCSIDDKTPVSSSYKDPKKIVIIMRKPYSRWPGDDPNRVERVLSNGDELVSAFESKFHEVSVVKIHPEDLPICEQIRYAHDADILVGVHGAGLVHSWWQRDSALLFEIFPDYEVSNIAFKVLTQLTGRRYKSYRIHDGGFEKHSFHVNVQDVLQSIEAAKR